MAEVARLGRGPVEREIEHYEARVHAERESQSQPDDQARRTPRASAHRTCDSAGGAPTERR